MMLLRNAVTPIILIPIALLFPNSFAAAQSLDTGAWTQVFVRECGPPRAGEDFPDCGSGAIQSELRVTDSDLGVTGRVDSSVIETMSQSFATAGYDGPAFTPTISAYSNSALGERIITSAIVIQRYEFEFDEPLTGRVILTYSQTGIDDSAPFFRSPLGYLLSGVVAFRTGNDLFEPERCGVDDLTTGVALVTCITAEAASQAPPNNNSPGLVYEGADEFINFELDDFSPQNNSTRSIEFSVPGETGDIVFLSGDMFMFANNGGFGDSRTTLKIELDNPEVVRATFEDETFVQAPQPVNIDIRPFSRKNKIRPRSRGLTSVAISGSQEFDVMQVIVATAQFGPNNAKAVPWLTRFRDINQDGFADLILRFRTRKTGIQCGDEEAILAGDTYLDDSFIGVDSVATVGCH